MTDIKISALTTKASPVGTDYVVIVDSEDFGTPPAGASGSNKKALISSLPSSGGGGGTGGASGWFNVTAAPYNASTSATASANATAFQAAWTACQAAGGGTIYVPRGTYNVACSAGGIGGNVAGTAIFWRGDGKYNTTLKASGSGVLFHAQDQTLWSSKVVHGGGILGMTLDGTNTTGTTDGILLDSINLFTFDVGIQNFIATSTSTGFHMNNSYSWSENLRGEMSAGNCANGYVFETTTNTSGNATGSFERSILTLGIQQHGNGNGLVLRNTADGLESNIILLGNFQNSASTVYSSISIDSGSDLTGHLFVGIENDGAPSGTSNAVLPVTVLGTGFLAGQIDASWDNSGGGWTASTLASNFLTGTVNGDANLGTITAANMNYYLAHNGTFL